MIKLQEKCFRNHTKIMDNLLFHIPIQIILHTFQICVMQLIVILCKITCRAKDNLCLLLGNIIATKSPLNENIRMLPAKISIQHQNSLFYTITLIRSISMICCQCSWSHYSFMRQNGICEYLQRS